MLHNGPQMNTKWEQNVDTIVRMCRKFEIIKPTTVYLLFLYKWSTQTKFNLDVNTEAGVTLH